MLYFILGPIFNLFPLCLNQNAPKYAALIVKADFWFATSAKLFLDYTCTESLFERVDVMCVGAVHG